MSDCKEFIKMDIYYIHYLEGEPKNGKTINILSTSITATVLVSSFCRLWYYAECVIGGIRWAFSKIFDNITNRKYIVPYINMVDLFWILPGPGKKSYAKNS